MYDENERFLLELASQLLELVRHVANNLYSHELNLGPRENVNKYQTATEYC